MKRVQMMLIPLLQRMHGSGSKLRKPPVLYQVVQAHFFQAIPNLLVDTSA